MTDVAVVGGGPAGSITAMLLARKGIDVLVLEGSPAWRWRACGVFTSPAAVRSLRRIGFSETDLGRVARPVPAMQVETRAGVRFRLTYGGHGSLADSAVGFDRAGLDQLLLVAARSAGAEVREGVRVLEVELGRRRPARAGTGGSAAAGGSAVTLRLASGPDLVAKVVVGADGRRSVVARAAAVDRPAAIGRRVGLTFHVPDRAGAAVRDARMVLIDDGYVGLAPTPGERLNVGIVLGPSWFGRLRSVAPERLVESILARVADPSLSGAADPGSLPILDHVAGAFPLGHRVSARSGEDWLLVGDAAGFLDPFTGEGLNRAIVSATLAAEAITAALGAGALSDASPTARARRSREAFRGYDLAMSRDFRGHDLVTRLVQGFLVRPSLFEYAARRLAGRPTVRDTMALVIGDLAPAARALDPRFLGALLRP